MPDLATIAFITLLAIGVWLLGIGIRGKRIDDHPLCRKCRFDLTGAPTDSVNCPECGVDAGNAKARVIGHRRRRPMMISVGSVFLLLSLTVIGLNASGTIRNINWIAYQPDWWLVMTAKSTDANRADAALTELVRRDELGGLSNKNRKAIVDHIFESLIPQLRTSQVEWSPVIERAWLDGTLSAERTLQYAQETLRLSIDMMGVQSVHKGDVLEFSITLSPPFGHRSTDMNLEIRPLEVRFGNHEYLVNPRTENLLIRSDMNWSRRYLQWDIPVEVDPGSSTLHLAWRVDCAIAGHPDTALTWQDSVEGPINVLPPGPDSVEFVADAQTAEQIRNALHFEVVGLRRISSMDTGSAIVGIRHADRLDARASIGIDLTVNNGVIEGTSLPMGVWWGSRSSFYVLVPNGSENKTIEFILYARKEVGWIAADGRVPPRDERPLWFGPPITIRIPIRWVDGPESEGVSEEIRRIVENESGPWPRDSER